MGHAIHFGVKKTLHVYFRFSVSCMGPVYQSVPQAHSLLIFLWKATFYICRQFLQICIDSCTMAESHTQPDAIIIIHICTFCIEKDKKNYE